MSAVALMFRYRGQSSANRRAVEDGGVEDVQWTWSGRSLMKHRKRTGLRYVPCGTPEVTAAVNDLLP